MDNKFYIGYNNFSFEENPSFDEIARTGKGVDFFFCHFDPKGKTLEEECELAASQAKRIKELGVDFIANFEFQNFVDRPVSPYGFDWGNNPDGTHRLRLPEGYVKALASQGNLIGIAYDEMEHILINTNLSITLAKNGRKHLPMFTPADTTDVVAQGEEISRQFREYSDEIRDGVAPVFSGEHVFPVLFHTFARNAIVPNFKSQKEGYSNVAFAVAAGAAMQYGTELWNCVDLWYRLTNPGHSPNEMYHNLVFAYLAGVDRAYVESAHALYTENRLNEYGNAFIKFCDGYKGKERSYSVRDYKPEIGIIRYDDTYWGQCDPVAWRRILFGNKKIKPDKRAKEWLKAFHLITHGETNRNGLTWNRISPWSLRRHRSFASMNGAAVFDDRAAKDKLDSLRLCFLCGYHISKETLAAVSELVKANGLTVVTTKRFAPDNIRAQAKGSFSKISDGKGCWIVTNNFCSKKLKNSISQFLGKKGEMVYRFGSETVRLRISADGESFERI